jgi:hypothetical protein
MAIERGVALEAARRLLDSIRRAREAIGDGDIGLDAETVCSYMLESKYAPSVNISRTVRIVHEIAGAEGVESVELAALLERELNASIEASSGTGGAQVDKRQLGLFLGLFNDDDAPKDKEREAETVRQRAEEEAKEIDTWEPTEEQIDSLPYSREWIKSVLHAFKVDKAGQTAKRPIVIFRGWLNIHADAASNRKA